jgi:hypothetical protein
MENRDVLTYISEYENLMICSAGSSGTDIWRAVHFKLGAMLHDTRVLASSTTGMNQSEGAARVSMPPVEESAASCRGIQWAAPRQAAPLQRKP